MNVLIVYGKQGLLLSNLGKRGCNVVKNKKKN